MSTSKSRHRCCESLIRDGTNTCTTQNYIRVRYESKRRNTEHAAGFVTTRHLDVANAQGSGSKLTKAVISISCVENESEYGRTSNDSSGQVGSGSCPLCLFDGMRAQQDIGSKQGAKHA